jgi:hypothetical protein
MQMWFLLGLLIAAGAVLAEFAVGPSGPTVILGGFLVGMLWEGVAELVRIREAIQEQTEALRRSGQNRPSAE